ncbi:hypothetical protein GPECTOR_116g357 [Gonium pectorale]|uniref:Uncharacterized protein n=1 Tax=Gonium pectorale TaxID=33097 RepID=A0A150G036_GONPE|nr:hypothetical protein GPECTOR_116g357 [Gonium pectorale]|eukprot:KXZ42825.1 hypothetical protein GPECTOR_116g357 [Gonium pectorale]
MDLQADAKEKAAAFTTILARKSKRVCDTDDLDDPEAADPPSERTSAAAAPPRPSSTSKPPDAGAAGAVAAPPPGRRSIRSVRSLASGGSGLSGFGDELEALLGGLDHFPDLLKELMAAPVQASARPFVLLPGDVNPEDAAQLQALSGCSPDEAVRLLDCLALLRAAAEALPEPDPPSQPATQPGEAPAAGSRPASAASAAAAAGSRVGSRAGSRPASASAAAVPSSEGRPRSAASASTFAGAGGGEAKVAAETAAPAQGRPPSAAKAALATPAAAPAAPITPTPQQLTRQLGTLASLVNDYPGLRTAAMARDAPAALVRVLLRHPERAVAANSALALGALASGPPPHKTSLIAGGVVTALLQALRGRTAAAATNCEAPGVAANAANALANLVNGHAAGAAALAAGGGIDTLLDLIAVDQPANVRTNAAGVLVQLTAAHESYRAAIVAAGGVEALSYGMLRGPDAPACNAATALYNLAVMTPPSLRPAMAQADSELAIAPQLLLCLAGRNKAGAADESVAAATAARTNASAVLLELCKDPSAAPHLASERLAVPAALAALAAGRLPPPPDDAAAAAAAADFLSGGVELLYPVPPVVRGNSLLCLMALARMGPEMQLELGRCGALGTLLELIAPGQDPAMQINSANAICSLAAANADIHAALVSARCVPLLAGLLQEGGVTGSSAADPGGVLCNSVGALAEATKYGDLRRSLVQVEFGEGLATLLRCLREAPEPAQGIAELEAPDGVVAPGGPSARLRHNAGRAAARDEAVAQAAAADADATDPAPGGPADRPGSQRAARRVWDGGSPAVRDSAQSLPVTPVVPADVDQDVDDVSTVITPPLPLGAF